MSLTCHTRMLMCVHTGRVNLGRQYMVVLPVNLSGVTSQPLRDESVVAANGGNRQRGDFVP